MMRRLERKAARLCSLLLALALVLSMMPTAALAAVTLTGDGTSESPYQIGTAAELEKFRDIVNGANGETQNKSACAVLTADIDLNNEAWTPIGGPYDAAYTGTFDGKGYTISGLKVDISTTAQVFAGLFGYVGFNQSGTVQNVHVSGSVSAESTTSGASVGGVVGCLFQGTVQNCAYTGAVSAQGKSSNAVHAGGVVGRNSGTVDGCLHSGNVSATADGTSATAGGVVGFNSLGFNSSGTLKRCAHVGGAVEATGTGNA
ncbi:MAG: hypothetical protein IIY43_13455, partial [Oscillospiraceae bacterium]|nr:hypothetical protein [Oscillospiraceae bacterium]